MVLVIKQMETSGLKIRSQVWCVGTQDKGQSHKQFVADTIMVSPRRFAGDQDWLYAQVKKDFQYFPDEWIQSYKWEIEVCKKWMPQDTEILCPVVC